MSDPTATTGHPVTFEAAHLGVETDLSRLVFALHFSDHGHTLRLMLSLPDAVKLLAEVQAALGDVAAIAAEMKRAHDPERN